MEGFMRHFGNQTGQPILSNLSSSLIPRDVSPRNQVDPTQNARNHRDPYQNQATDQNIPNQNQANLHRQHADIETFDDEEEETELTQDAGNPPGQGNPASDPRQDQDGEVLREIIKFEPGILPEDAKRLKREREEYEAEGIYPDGYECEKCVHGDDGIANNDVNEELQKIYTMDRMHFRRVPDRVRHSMMAEHYNKKILSYVRTDQPELEPWTPVKLKWHENECNKRNLLKMTYDELDFMTVQEKYGALERKKKNTF